MSVQGIAAEIQAMIDEARREAFREGWEAMKASIMNAQPPLPKGCETNEDADEQRAEAPEAREAKLSRLATRAPRGLTNRVLKTLLFEHGLGMTTENAKAAAVARDPRISPRTVYNELHREADFYRDNGGNWRLTNPDAVRAELVNAPNERDEEDAPIAH